MIMRKARSPIELAGRGTEAREPDILIGHNSPEATGLRLLRIVPPPLELIQT